jgi:hypothetical protein
MLDQEKNCQFFDKPKQQKKFNSVKWCQFKTVIHGHCSNMANVKDRSVYLTTLSAASVKRSLCRMYERVFKSRRSGYEQFLSDEEKKLILMADNCSPHIVEQYY